MEGGQCPSWSQMATCLKVMAKDGGLCPWWPRQQLVALMASDGILIAGHEACETTSILGIAAANCPGDGLRLLTEQAPSQAALRGVCGHDIFWECPACFPELLPMGWLPSFHVHSSIDWVVKSPLTGAWFTSEMSRLKTGAFSVHPPAHSQSPGTLRACPSLPSSFSPLVPLRPEEGTLLVEDVARLLQVPSSTFTDVE
ncbi:hypothetical protein P7K49_026120 [Saguinus oedipus]|uniref:Uncharacterized protein n=1 Tax=Saguinus oedipus TaxID=9490 RepID=A0ABQ9UJN2_SAGOE|nr:hypothetical protein P7K49_026120 [Saguinus oedipus]